MLAAVASACAGAGTALLRAACLASASQDSGLIEPSETKRSSFSTRSSTDFPRASRRATSLRRLTSCSSFGLATEPPKSAPPPGYIGHGTPRPGLRADTSLPRQLDDSISRATVRIDAGSKPNLLCSAFKGADAPKVCMPITRPFGPM